MGLERRRGRRRLTDEALRRGIFYALTTATVLQTAGPAWSCLRKTRVVLTVRREGGAARRPWSSGAPQSGPQPSDPLHHSAEHAVIAL